MKAEQFMSIWRAYAAAALSATNPPLPFNAAYQADKMMQEHLKRLELLDETEGAQMRILLHKLPNTK